MDFQGKLVLYPGETLENHRRISCPILGIHSRDSYEVLNWNGMRVGSVVVSEKRAILPPHKRTRRLVQKNLVGDIVAKHEW